MVEFQKNKLCIGRALNYLLLRNLSSIFLINSVIAIHNGQKGVAGPSQNARYPPAIPISIVELLIRPKIPHTQIGDVITIVTTAKTIRLCQSFSCIQSHLKKLIIFVLIFLILQTTQKTTSNSITFRKIFQVNVHKFHLFINI